MPLAMIRANLGKWGRSTQTFYEHGVAVYTFRTMFNLPSQHIVVRYAKECGIGQELLNSYNDLVFLESLYHDYDKLFVPEDMVRNAEAMKRFSEHGNVEAERNREALRILMSSLEGEEASILPSSVRDLLRKVESSTIENVLRAANASHEGMRTPEKIEMVAEALSSFFEEIGCPLSDPIPLAKAHSMSLRVADSIASAWEGRPSFKSDVTEIVEMIRSFQQIVGSPTLHVISLSLNRALFEARPSSVVSAFLSFYDSLRKLVDTEVVRTRLGGLSLLRGSVIEDNSSLIVAAWLGTPEDELDLKKEFSNVPSNVLGDLVTYRHWKVDLVADKRNFDVMLRDALMNALHSGFRPVLTKSGLPCYSCGRPMAVVMDSKELKKYLSGSPETSKALSDEMITLEKSMQLGYLRAISGSVYGHTERLEHNDRPLCPTCLWLFSRSSPEGGTPVTFVLYGTDRIMNVSSPLCSEDTDPLVVEMFSYYLRELVLSKLRSSFVSRDFRRYGLSVMVSHMKSKGEDLLGELKALLSDIREGLGDEGVDLPCGRVTYRFEWGLRIGNGPMSPGMVWDHALIRGVWAPEDYDKLLERIGDSIKKLRDLRLRPEEVVHKLEGGRAQIGAVLLKEMDGRIPKGLTLEKFMDLVEYLRESQELGALRMVREVLRKNE